MLIAVIACIILTTIIDDDLYEHMHCCWVICSCIICWVGFSYPYCRRRILCIQLLTATIADDYHVFVASW